MMTKECESLIKKICQINGESIATVKIGENGNIHVYAQEKRVYTRYRVMAAYEAITGRLTNMGRISVEKVNSGE